MMHAQIKAEAARALVATIEDPEAECKKRWPDYAAGEEARPIAGSSIFLVARWTEAGQPRPYRWELPVLEASEGEPHVVASARVAVARAVLVDAELRKVTR